MKKSNRSSKKIKIAILVDGGAVQEVVSSNPDVVVEIFDMDNEEEFPNNVLDDLSFSSYDDYVVQNKMVNVYY